MTTISKGVPNACNQCHLDKSANWSVAEARRLWPKRFAQAPPSSDERFDVPEALRALFAGDGLTRALEAEAMGSLTTATNRQWAAPYLLEAFEDNYPIVRFFAANGLARFESSLEKLDYLADARTRARAVQQRRKELAGPAEERAATLAVRLRKQRQDVDLEVGE
jgi:hypothetical protein